MAAKTLNLEGAKSASITLVEDAGRGLQAVHDVIVAMHANRRSGTAHTKTRGEVSATGKKPFKQKGTGRARQGGNASPIHRGGGVAFGPRHRDYSKKVNRNTRRLAFSKVLTERIAEGDVLTVADFAIADGNPARVRAINSVGLSRRGFTEESVAAIKRAHRVLYREQRNYREAVEILRGWDERDPADTTRPCRP